MTSLTELRELAEQATPDALTEVTEYPTDCPCGSRCDGHAIGAPEDPGCEWCGVVLDDDTCDPNDPDHFAPDPIYSDHSPREEWVRAWKVKQETHR